MARAARADQTGVRAARARSLQTVTIGAWEIVAGRTKGTNRLDAGFRVTYRTRASSHRACPYRFIRILSANTKSAI
jgi:hypothetical protein